MTVSAPFSLSPVRLGILLTLLGMLLFALNDAMGKWLLTTYSVGQVLLIRSLFALLFLVPMIWRAGGVKLLIVQRRGLQALRVGFSTLEVLCFYGAVAAMPLADVATFWLAAPICVAALSPLLLNERASGARWIAIGLGFAGVLIALAPTGQGGFGPKALAIVGTLSFAMMVVTGRTLRGTPDLALVFWQNVGAGVAGLVLSPFAWVEPGRLDLLLLGLLGVVAMAAHICVTRALKLASAVIVAPFQYALLPYAILFGWLFFSDLPQPLTLLGAAVIAGSGLFLFWRGERA